MRALEDLKGRNAARNLSRETEKGPLTKKSDQFIFLASSLLLIFKGCLSVKNIIFSRLYMKNTPSFLLFVF